MYVLDNCLICNKDQKSNSGLGLHLRKAHSVSLEGYLLQHKYNNVVPLCKCGCGQNVLFFKTDYREFLQGHWVKINKELLYNKENLLKRKTTNNIRYGGNTPASSLEIRNKIKQTNIEKYGFESPAQNDQVKMKMKTTMIERYGAQTYMQISGNVDKMKQSMIVKYGVDNPSKLDWVVDKIKETTLQNHGVGSYVLHPDCVKKAKESNLLKYGVEYYSQSQEAKVKNAEGRFSFEEIIAACKIKNYEPFFEYKTYENMNQLLSFRCLKHNFIFETKFTIIVNFPDFMQCPKCKYENDSKGQREICEFIQLNYREDILINSKEAIGPREIDVFLPDKKFGVEYHGLFWHSSKYKKKDYHLKKFLSCQEKGIKLFQFYEDEWRDKKDICKSMISNSIGLSTKLNARSLFVEEINKKIEKKFIDDNHMQGATNSCKCFALVDKDKEVFMVLSLRKPFTKKNVDKIEIARVCCKKNIQIRGGFSKLMKYAIEFCKASNYKSILTYSDCRYSSGVTYDKYGFLYKGTSSVSYDYTDGIDRYGRFRFRAQPGKTEKEVAEESKVYKIYGTGNFIWELNI